MRELPPPPENPDRPPPLRLAGEQQLVLQAADGVGLEARGYFPSDAERSLVLCHPHPLYGGTMHNALIGMLARMAQQVMSAPIATLRFNFRGVEGSAGTYDDGRGETLDVQAAVDHMRRSFPAAPVTVIGYSFGSWVGLRAAWARADVERLVMVAPAVRLLRYEQDLRRDRRRFPCLVVIGDRDQFATIEQARQLASWVDAELVVEKGTDHFFVGRRRKVSARILPFAAPEALWLS